MHHLIASTLIPSRYFSSSSTSHLLSSAQSTVNCMSLHNPIPFRSLSSIQLMLSAFSEGRGRQRLCLHVHSNAVLINGHIQFKWLRRRASARPRFPCPKRETSCGISQNPATPTTSESTRDRIKVDDRQITRRTKIHGAAPRVGLSSSGGGDRKIVPVPIGIQDEV